MLANSAGLQGLKPLSRPWTAVADFRELTQMEAHARNNEWKILQERMQENLGNLQKLLRPK